MDHVPAPVQRELHSLSTRLREPVRVAVVGRVKAGKSTMVNALLGQKVAQTDVSECTRVVTWFRYGHPQRVTINMKDGTERETQLTPDGMLPIELGVPVDLVASIHAYLANESLRGMTVIDTPGIGSVHSGYSASTEELVAASKSTDAATTAADAVVFLFGQAMMSDELRTLQVFRSTGNDGGSGSAANAVGVLSRADQLGDGTRDSWDVAVDLAGHYAGVFRGEVATVVPVIGLIAETAEAATLTENDATNLRHLAGLDARAVERMLWSVDRFVSAEAPISPESRSRLLELLDLYGTKKAVEMLQGEISGAVGLRRELSSVSGIAGVKSTLWNYFRDQDHVLKVRSALTILNRLSYMSAEGTEKKGLEEMRAGVESLKLDPDFHQVAELEAWHDCCTGKVELPADFAEDMRRLTTPGSPAMRLGMDTTDKVALAEAAKEGMARWRTFMAFEATPAQTKVARTMTRSYQILWQELQ